MCRETAGRILCFLLMLETENKRDFEKLYNCLIAAPGKAAFNKHDSRRCCSRVFAKNPRWN